MSQTCDPVTVTSKNQIQRKKVIYVKVLNRIESIEFAVDTSADDLRETLRSAAEANPNDILKLYKSNGNLVTISAQCLEENSPDQPYKLNFIVKNLINHQNNDVRILVDRIEQLERRLNSVSTTTDYAKVDSLNMKLNLLCQKLESLEHLSWLGFFKENKTSAIGTNLIGDKSLKKEKNQQVLLSFKQHILVALSDETRQYLKTPTFNNWNFEDHEMLLLLQQMFVDLELTTRFAIKLETLQEYLLEIYSNYNDVPFHNFRHAFVVTQMMYGLIWQTRLHERLDPLDLFVLLVSAISHDLDHDGYNNAFQINARTHLALIYNDKSPLEMYHCAVAFHILGKSGCNILETLDDQQYRQFREKMIHLILATDMSYHNSILKSFNDVVTDFDFNLPEHKLLLMKILMKTSDISNEGRPVEVSELWFDCLITEFFNQGDHEKLNGLPLTPLMDRDNFSKSKSQIGFISFVLLPLVESLSELFPELKDTLVKQVNASLEHYQAMKVREENKAKENMSQTELKASD